MRECLLIDDLAAAEERERNLFTAYADLKFFSFLIVVVSDEHPHNAALFIAELAGVD